MPLTEEQQAIVESPADLLKVKAFAGTGKTFTLVEYAKARPKEPMLYLAFNRSIRREAERKFPKNVTCLTSHAPAYRSIGVAYKDKLVEDSRPREWVEALRLDRIVAAGESYLLAHQALQCLKNWLASDREALDERSIVPLRRGTSPFADSLVVATANDGWQRMVDHADSAVGMTHDGYLKLYQLSKPVWPYQRILFDEAQDANPVTTDLVLRQRAHKVFVGDPHQQIYGFRGADDALEKLNAEETLYLSGSWRFGPHVAGIANVLLARFKGETVRVKGLGGADEIASVDRQQPHTILCRGNASIFTAAIANMDAHPHFVGGINGYRLDRLLSAHDLRVGESVRDPYLASFRDWQEFSDIAETTDDREALSLIRICERYQDGLPGLIGAVRRNASPTPQGAGVTLSTGHKAKGLEWDQVRLASDFPDLLDEEQAPAQAGDLEDEEINLIYVAATRAKRRLEPYAGLTDFLIQLARERQAQ
ncbi:MAG: UvrD-helicase domain-containing protein [Chromatiales bacterium]|nr:UvrD-helicase domain-containing protein [Chromatiales bacterium]